MNNRKKEIAKFLCGAEAFHALIHAYLLVSGTQLTAIGITTTPTLNVVSVLVNAGLAFALGIYAWRQPQPQPPRQSSR